ncbi:MAG: ATP-dependent RecD-like DNA helicase [Lachnospiraceae bacterium]|nr:ATP-dependent RecD-like DNA helicase [Lachnospiraceae bacterium]
METIRGYIDKFIHESADGVFKILVLVSKGKETVCLGNCSDLEIGENVELEGEFFDAPGYGKEFRISSYRVHIPEDSESIERYLGSGAIKGLGMVLAARIVEKFGDDTLRIIDEEPERLAEIKGVSRRRAMEIAVQVEEKRDLRDAMIFLSQYGISQNLSVKIFDTYGISLKKVMKENPYKLAEDIRGVGFITADNIALKMGIPENSAHRIRCAMLYILQQASGEGHTYLPVGELMSRVKELINTDEEIIKNELSGLTLDRKVIIRDEKAYTAQFFYAEQNCARLLNDLNMPLERFTGEDEEILLGKLKTVAGAQGMDVDRIQLEAVEGCIKNSVFILTGGPGTGKTTTINLMIGYFLSCQMSVMLAAPTGRAAKRMSEATGFEAMTIHRLLEVGGGQDNDSNMYFQKNEESPLETDVIIIDEVSMVDILLFQGLLKAIVPGTRLILVGDAAQLPSVGPGQVLRELIDSGAFPCQKLKKIFRQAEDSDIVVNAHKINKGEDIRLDTASKDFLFLERDSYSTIREIMVWMMKDKLPGYCDADVFDIQVLTPVRRGMLGCVELNTYLQGILNPPEAGKREHMSGDILFREGDKVMQVKNDYKLEWNIYGNYRTIIESGLGVFNGDTGIITEIDEAAGMMKVRFDDRRVAVYPFAILDELEPAYAITIHKSQGSEYPAVIIPMLDVPEIMRYRNLLYTGVTRGKKCVVLLGRSSIVREMIKNESGKSRYTSLRERIAEICG